MSTLPDGFGLVLDPLLRRFRHGTVLAGGRPGRVLTLTPDGARALDSLLAGGAADAATRTLAGRLVATGMAHPRRLTGVPITPTPPPRAKPTPAIAAPWG